MSHSTGSTSSIAHPEIEALWQRANPDLEAMGTIIESHFNSSCLAQVQIGAGGYARVFMYTLRNGTRFAAKICLPIGETSKTEAEVATMDSIRGQWPQPLNYGGRLTKSLVSSDINTCPEGIYLL